jgi:hypothetical protein
MEPRRKKSRETKLASVNYEKPDFWDSDAEEQNFPLSGFGYFGYGDSRHHLNQNEPFQWHVGQHTRALDGPIEFLSLGVCSPPFWSPAVNSAFSLPTTPSAPIRQDSKHIDVTCQTLSKGATCYA